MNSPVDIKAVIDAMGAAEEARSLPVRVHVYLDDTASEDLANIAIAATRTAAPNAAVVYDSYPPAHAIPDAAADMALLVAGEGGRTGALYADLQAVGVPALVLALDAESLRAAAAKAGAPVAFADVIAPRHRADAAALPDRAGNSPMALDSSDARALFEDFGRWVVGVFQEKRLAFAHAFACVRRPLALESINATAVQNAGIGVVAVIPGADLPLMTLNQVKMLLEIAAAYGEELSFGRLKEIAAVVGGALGCRAVARQVVGAVPVLGWAVKGGIGYAGTQAMGHALLEYFEQGANVPATAQGLADAVKAAPGWMGLARGNGLGENLKRAGGAAKDKLADAAAAAARNAGPALGSVASAAGDAVGFTGKDVAELANKALQAVRNRTGK